MRGVVNFAGGLRNAACAGWENNLIDAFGDYGRTARYPSLWFYGDNDSYWSRPAWEAMHRAYVGAGGDARMVAFGTFATGDAHGMFGSRAGQSIWLPEFDRFAAALGLRTARTSGRPVGTDPATPAGAQRAAPAD